MPSPLAGLIDRLEALYGAPEPPAVTDPFAMVVQENAAYLVDDERRAAVFARLDEEIGVEPEAILGAPLPILAKVITDGGMLPEHRADKLQKAAAIVLTCKRTVPLCEICPLRDECPWWRQSIQH